MKFLGNIDAGRVDDITQGMQRACRELAPFKLALSNLGVFPNASRPRVVWAGVQGDLEPLVRLQTGIETHLARLGFPPENRPFTPHLTLGRVRDQASNPQRSRLGNAVSACFTEAPQPWSVQAAHLVRSDLGPRGATYTNLASVPLGGGTN